MPVKRVIIVHGHAAKPTMHWFIDLENFLQRAGYQDILIPRMPNPQLPTISRWKRRLVPFIEDSEQTAIIGHSFGAITALRLASDLAPERKLGAVIVVACPIKWVWGRIPARVLYREPDWEHVHQSVSRQAIIHSNNDWIAPVKNATYMQNKLGCEPLILHNYRHLCCQVLPSEAKTHILNILNQ